MIASGWSKGFSALTLATDAGVEAAFVPSAGMVGCSLSDRGEELLGQRGGLRHYIEQRSTMGIPLLHPWANRRRADEVPGRREGGRPGRRSAAAFPRPRRGCPIHGLLAAAEGWQVDRHEATEDGGRARRELRLRRPPRAAGGVSRSHTEVLCEGTLQGPTLTITTTVHASGDTSVPISFGYHPYLRLPGVDRAEWEVENPGARAPEARSPNAPDRRPRADRGGEWSAWRADVR